MPPRRDAGRGHRPPRCPKSSHTGPLFTPVSLSCVDDRKPEGHTKHVLIKALQTEDVTNTVVLVALPKNLWPGLDDHHDGPVVALSHGFGLKNFLVQDVDGLLEDLCAVEVGGREENVTGLISERAYSGERHRKLTDILQPAAIHWSSCTKLHGGPSWRCWGFDRNR